MEPRYYNYAGLRIVSEFALPEWATFEQTSPTGEADVVIALDRGFDPESKAGEESRISAPGLGYIRVKAGRQILITPGANIAPDRLRPWLIGAAWGSLCYQRGLFLIHASAVSVDGEAVLFCARAKGGKSTLAAQLNTRGHALISDDLCHVDIPDQGCPTVYPSAPRLKLWSDALEGLGWNSAHLEPDHARHGKFHVVRAANNRVGVAPVRAIYLLGWGELGIRRLSGLPAWHRFLGAATYRPKLIDSPDQLSRYANQSTTILQRIPVWELRRPRDLATGGKTIDLLACHWSSHRMMDT